MNAKHVTAVVAAGIVMFLVGFLLYGVLLMGFFESNAVAGVMKDPPEWLWLVLGQFVTAWILFLVLCWAGAASVAEGAKKGAVFGLLWSLGYGLTMYGTANVANLTVTLVDPLVAAVIFGAAGAVIGMILGKDAAAA